MFEHTDASGSGTRIGRRGFLAAAAATVGAGGWALSRRGARAPATSGEARTVTVIRFDDRGERLEQVETPKVVKSEAEWRKILTPGQFYVTRQADTELPFQNEYWNLDEDGLFRCVCCGNALFDSRTKFHSGTGWPSFTAPVAEENVVSKSDTSHFMVRTEVLCRECDAHLGHLFEDGPAPTGLRYCMNSASLKFVPRKGPAAAPHS